METDRADFAAVTPPPSRAELRRRLHEKIHFARSQRTRGKPAIAGTGDGENEGGTEAEAESAGGDGGNDEAGAGAAEPKSEAARRRAKKKRERRRQRKLAKAYDRGGMDGMMNAMGIKDPTIRDAVHRVTGSGSNQLRPGSGAPTQETVDGLIGRFQDLAGAAEAPAPAPLSVPNPAPTSDVVNPNDRPLLEDIAD